MKGLCRALQELYTTWLVNGQGFSAWGGAPMKGKLDVLKIKVEFFLVMALHIQA